MAVQAPLFSESLDFPVRFIDQVQSLRVNEPVISSSPSSDLDFQPFSAEILRQRREIDMFLHLQNERLKHTIQEQRRQQITSLISSLEATTMAVMRKTEHELAKVKTRTRELEESLKTAEMEVRAWQRAAMENEAMVVGLNNTLNQIKQRLHMDSISNQAQDAESVCESSGANFEFGCKWCGVRRSSVVLLPCRHLCVCSRCGSFLGMCPVCGTVKEGSIEVALSNLGQ